MAAAFNARWRGEARHFTAYYIIQKKERLEVTFHGVNIKLHLLLNFFPPRDSSCLFRSRLKGYMFYIYIYIYLYIRVLCCGTAEATHILSSCLEAAGGRSRTH